MDTNTPKQQPSFQTSRWHTLQAWVTTHKKTSIAIAACLLILISGGVALALAYKKPTEFLSIPLTGKVKKKPVPKYYSPLTGLPLPDKAATKRPITAIMIENSPDSRPQSGMQEAEITYEAIAEAGITRFLNIYQQNKPGLIGPVRSLRPYYVDWLAPWQASVVHVGGSKRALDEVRNGTYRDVDQFFHPDSYWRSADRYAPHNVYTSFEKLDALNAGKGYTQSDPKPLKHGKTSKSKSPNATNITVNMSSHQYNSNWLYHAKSNTYHRHQAGEPHIDREVGQISSNVVVVLKMTMDKVMEDGWRENYHSSGSGEAVVFQDGIAHEVTWHKPAPDQQLHFTSKDGKEFLLARGKTWISAIPVNDGGSVSWQ